MPVDVWNIHLYVLQERSCMKTPENCWGAEIPAGFSTELVGVENYTIYDNNNFDLAWAQIVSLRLWMKVNGQQDKPLIISEYGVLLPTWFECNGYPTDTTGCKFTPEKVRDMFMYPSFDKFLNYTDASLGYPKDDNRLVQRWNWFSIDYDKGKCEGKDFFEFFGGTLFYSGLTQFVLITTYLTECHLWVSIGNNMFKIFRRVQ